MKGGSEVRGGMRGERQKGGRGARKNEGMVELCSYVCVCMYKIANYIIIHSSKPL